MALSPSSNPKDQMIAAAVMLVRSRGASATGFSDIIEASGAPRGSIYHHFPNGKSELLAAMIDRAANLVGKVIKAQAAEAASPADLVRRIADVFSDAPIASGWTQGCPVAAATVEGDHQPEPVRQATAQAFDHWIDAIALALARFGIADKDGTDFASAIVAGIEGGLILARAQRDVRAYDGIVALLVERAAAFPASAG